MLKRKQGTAEEYINVLEERLIEKNIKSDT